MQIATYHFFLANFMSLPIQFNMADPEGALVEIERSEKLLHELAADQPEWAAKPEYTTAKENMLACKAWYLHQLEREAEARAIFEAQHKERGGEQGVSGCREGSRHAGARRYRGRELR